MFTQKMAKALATEKDIVFISGRYEGIDARVKNILKAEEVSVGDYVLTGGELPALTIIDAISRQVPGVLGTHESLEDDRAASGEVYTRPDVLLWKKKKYPVPDVLKSGNHAELLRWQQEHDV
jgi:tRNA (guanine37-N1)-methyltransferase